MEIKAVLDEINSQYTVLVETVLLKGYITPPDGYKWHGVYRICLSDEEKTIVLNELGRAKIVFSDKGSSQKDRDYLDQFYNYWKRCIEEEPIPFNEAIKTQPYYDLRLISLAEFEKLIFDHEVPDENDESISWYHNSEMWIDYDANYLAGLYIALFKNSHKLLEKFSRTQLEQGFWAIPKHWLSNCSIYGLIWSEQLNIELKEQLIASMYDLYANLFMIDPLETASYMWWDSLAYDFNPMKHRTRNNPIEKRIQDAMFSTLSKILELDSEKCRISALHGLGHVHHPNTKTVINAHLEKNIHANEDYISYAEACIKGDIM